MTAGTTGRSGTLIGELVEGLDEIAALPIPYARLPKRAEVGWAPALRTWADVAGQTVTSLLARPKAGEALLRDLLVAANEAVQASRMAEPAAAAASASRLLDRLSERDRILLAARTWAPHPAGADKLAELLGISANALWRHQPRAQSRFVELLDDPAHADLKTHGAALATRLGTVTTAPAVKAALAEAGTDYDSPQGLLLAYVAGPYRQHGVWLENTTAGGFTAAEAAVTSTLTRLKTPTTSVLVRELHRVGLTGETAGEFLQSCAAARRFGDRWVRWGSQAADQIEAVLHLSHNPTTAEVIGAVLGDTSSAAVIRSTLFDDARFVRTTRHTWGLREWGVEEYAGIYGEILNRLDVVGEISVADLVREMKADFPDVAEASIRTYASRPAFVIENGLLRRRTPRDGWPAAPALNTARGVFSNGDNEIRVCYLVDRELLRGSGQQLAPAVAAALGLAPGEQLVLSSPHRDLKAWWLSATRGPTIGSLRALAAAARARAGDHLVLVFDRRLRRVSVQRIAAGDDLGRRVTVLLGKPVRHPLPALARSLSCPAGEVLALLRARGDVALADLLDRAN